MRTPTQFAAVYTVLQREDGHIFMLKRANTGYFDGYWNLPAGHIENGEMPLTAATRETLEEAGANVTEDQLEFVTVMHRMRKGERTYTDYLFKATSWHNEPHNAEPEKASEGAWFAPQNLPENTTPNQRALLGTLITKTPYLQYLEETPNDLG